MIRFNAYMEVSLNYCSQNRGNLYRAPYHNGNPNIGPRIIRNLDQYPHNGHKLSLGYSEGPGMVEPLSQGAHIYIYIYMYGGFPKLGVPFWGSL